MSFSIDPDLLGLVDHIALVTGASAGIGKGCAIQLARAGCHVAVVDIDEKAGLDTVREIEKLGRKAIFIQANARKADQVNNMVNQVISSFGKLDVAVNNVGNPTSGAVPFLDYTEATWDDNIEQNLKTCFLCCQTEALAMIEHDTPGSIINVASSSGVVAGPTVAAYGAAKAGVIHLTKSLGMELAPFNIRVNCIIPGTHLTEKVKARLADPNIPEERKTFTRLAAKAPPLGRLGDPMETGGLAVFFASKLSSYVTGHSLLSDGGITLTTNRPPVGGNAKPAAVIKLGK